MTKKKVQDEQRKFVPGVLHNHPWLDFGFRRFNKSSNSVTTTTKTKSYKKIPYSTLDFRILLN